jgi:hypothetical protein
MKSQETIRKLKAKRRQHPTGEKGGYRFDHNLLIINETVDNYFVLKVGRGNRKVRSKGIRFGNNLNPCGTIIKSKIVSTTP